MIENRIKNLEEAHQLLNKRIDGLESTGKFDDEQLVNLKKQRLNILDELTQLRNEHPQEQ